MNLPVIARVERGGRHTAPGLRPVVTLIVALWFAGVVGAHYSGLLRSPPGILNARGLRRGAVTVVDAEA